MTQDAPADPMEAALAEAEAAAARDEVPIGAVVVEAATGRIVARAGNRVEELKDPTAHAELLAIREAARVLGAKRLPETELWVTLEPCPMCAQAASFARVARLVFAADDPKGGGVLRGPRIFEQPTCFHRPALARGTPDQAQRAGDLLRDFFRVRRNGR
jgi:tRNA(Arg) A34 adenosine deaminase TadA